MFRSLVLTLPASNCTTEDCDKGSHYYGTIIGTGVGLSRSDLPPPAPGLRRRSLRSELEFDVERNDIDYNVLQ